MTDLLGDIFSAMFPESGPDTAGLCYLSFTSDGFLGAAFVYGREIIGATRRAHALGINPGGEVACWVLLDDRWPPESWRERLLQKPDLAELDKMMGGDGTLRKGSASELEDGGGTEITEYRDGQDD